MSEPVIVGPWGGHVIGPSGSWEPKPKPTADDVLKEFEAGPLADGWSMLLAAYEQGECEGSAFVLLRGEDGELWSVTASHCSCFGLEGQWAPQVDSRENLERLLREGYGDTKRFAEMALIALAAEANA